MGRNTKPLQEPSSLRMAFCTRWANFKTEPWNNFKTEQWKWNSIVALTPLALQLR
jgi:hypothetical protein